VPPTPPDAPVTITVNFEPDNTNAAAQAAFLADVNTFQAAHKNITVTANTSAMDPKTFPTKLAGGQVENVFYTYFTDPANLIAHHQVADISSYLKEFPAVASISPAYMKIYSDSSGHVYGLPISNYSMGLVYNRALFTQAGLDPNSPPTTWADVQTDATKIAALGNGIVGYADYSKSNTGGWHFTAEMYSRGGDIASNASGSWKADFNNPTGVAVLQQLHDMRYTDKSMGERQLLEYPDILSMMGAGKLGMYIAAADNVTQVTQQFKIDVKDMGFGPMPDGKGTLGGGAGFMFNVKDTPAQIRAGLAWLTYEYDNPDRFEDAAKTAVANKSTVGLPDPNIWTGATGDKYNQIQTQYANVPTQNYTAYVTARANIPLNVEPPAAQQLYAILDTVMAKTLTDPNANFQQLLADAETQCNSVLATVTS
jgi:ABC-type glycerol-3-phosphate transport system substrate-binding protein